LLSSLIFAFWWILICFIQTIFILFPFILLFLLVYWWKIISILIFQQIALELIHKICSPLIFFLFFLININYLFIYTCLKLRCLNLSMIIIITNVLSLLLQDNLVLYFTLFFNLNLLFLFLFILFFFFLTIFLFGFWK
jgi:hypothetical protein